MSTEFVAIGFMAISVVLIVRLANQRNFALVAMILPRLYMGAIYISVSAGALTMAAWQDWGRGGLMALVVGDLTYQAYEFFLAHKHQHKLSAAGAILAVLSVFMVAATLP